MLTNQAKVQKKQSFELFVYHNHPWKPEKRKTALGGRRGIWIHTTSGLGNYGADSLFLPK